MSPLTYLPPAGGKARRQGTPLGYTTALPARPPGSVRPPAGPPLPGIYFPSPCAPLHLVPGTRRQDWALPCARVRERATGGAPRDWPASPTQRAAGAGAAAGTHRRARGGARAGLDRPMDAARAWRQWNQNRGRGATGRGTFPLCRRDVMMRPPSPGHASPITSSLIRARTAVAACGRVGPATRVRACDASQFA